MATELQHNVNNNASNNVNNEEYATTDEVLDDHATANMNKRKGRPPSTNQIHDFAINYMAFMLIQLFGNSVTALDTVSGMLGLGIHCGSHQSWAVVMNCCGEAQQKVADAVQKSNQQNEINTMKEKGIEPVMDNGKAIWPLTISYDMAWPGRNVYLANSITAVLGMDFLWHCIPTKSLVVLYTVILCLLQK